MFYIRLVRNSLVSLFTNPHLLITGFWAAELVLIYCTPLPTYATPTPWGILKGRKQGAYL